jgi:hypothetical protein
VPVVVKEVRKRPRLRTTGEFPSPDHRSRAANYRCTHSPQDGIALGVLGDGVRSRQSKDRTQHPLPALAPTHSGLDAPGHHVSRVMRDHTGLADFPGLE